ncbi:MAG: peptide ABC transporter substrate-binding protein [Stagnimonas sp.]|nr:peptide ABC transporter substrate-binding protein [Stagnimonas sp.]
MRCRALLAGALALLWSIGVSAAERAPVAQQVLHHGNGSEPNALDPHRVEGVSANNIVRDLFEGLTGISPTGEVIPAAAAQWTISEDGRIYTFALRENLRWSDGSALTAEDFVAGFQRSINPATGNTFAQMLSAIDNADAVLKGRVPVTALGVSAPDARTVVIRLAAPTPYLLGLLSHPTAFPVHRPSLEKWGRDFARPGRLVSNGAYVLKNWVVQSQIEIARNPQYWNNANTVVERVFYHPSEDINAELKRYAADEFDSTYEIPLVQAKALRVRYGKELHVAAYLGSYFYGFNLSKPPFKGNPKLRQALTMAIDREVIVGKVMNGVALPAYSYVPSGTWNYTPQVPDWAAWPREKKLAAARRLYAEAGYSAANPLTVELRYNTHDDHKRIALVMAAMWKQWLGVNTRLINEEFKVFLQNRKLHEVTQLFRSAWISDYDDATSFLDLQTTTHGRNDSVYRNPAYDALLQQAATTADIAARRALLEQAERLLLIDLPVLPIYTYVSKHLVKPWVAGWQDNSYDYHYSKDLQVLAHPERRAAR